MSYEAWPNIPIPINLTTNVPIPIDWSAARPWNAYYAYPPAPAVPTPTFQVTLGNDWRVQVLEAKVARLERQVRQLRRERVVRRRGGTR